MVVGKYGNCYDTCPLAGEGCSEGYCPIVDHESPVVIVDEAVNMDLGPVEEPPDWTEFEG